MARSPSLPTAGDHRSKAEDQTDPPPAIVWGRVVTRLSLCSAPAASRRNLRTAGCGSHVAIYSQPAIVCKTLIRCRWMAVWLQKFVIAVAMIGIAGASVTAPGSANASGLSAYLIMVAKHDPNADEVDVHAGGAAAAPCHEHGQLHGKGKLNHPCCAATCAGALAFIFAAINLSYPTIGITGATRVHHTFLPAPIASIERPPRSV